MRISALLLVCLAVPVQAQIAPGLSGSSTTTYTTNATEFWQDLRGFGTCFARQSETAAWALIATEPNSKAEAAVYKKMSRGESQSCLTDTSLSAPVPLIRGAIAEALYKRRVAVPAELVQAPLPEGTPIKMLGEAARCYAASHRADADKLLSQTMPGSKNELAALKAMSDDFFRCLPEKAQKFSFNPTQVRYRLAEALLRMPQSPAALEGAK